MIIKLKYKVLLIYLVFGLLIFLLTTFTVSPYLSDFQFKTLQQEIKTQLAHIDLALSTFMKNIQVNVEIISGNNEVRTKNDHFFTHFLNADERNFRYRTTEPELRIIKIFNSYRQAHPYIHSVYMGRENGSFVRSHPRARPTKYDPRVRPWYQLAKQNPGKMMMTAAYPSLTTRDINIGIVKALVDEKGKVYGVVGMDVTLKDLTRYMAHVKLMRNGYMMLLDNKGVILVGESSNESFQWVGNKIPLYKKIYSIDSGNLIFERNRTGYYCFYYSSKILGWKILSIVPVDDIHGEINRIILRFIVYCMLSLVLLSVVTRTGLHRYILNPIARLCVVVSDITKKKNYNSKVNVKNKDELGELASSFNQMIESIKETDILLNNSKKRIEDALAQAQSVNRFKEELFSILSHEIRTPITGVMGFSELILNNQEVNETVKKFAKKIFESSKRLNELLINLIELSDLQANGKNKIKIKKINLKKLISNVLTMLSYRIEEQQCTVNVNIKCKNEIHSDYVKLELVLLNIISNAIKFSPSVVIHIEIDRFNEECQFSISDTGIGIKEENLSLIFELFKQVDSSTIRRFEGLGVGLTVSKEIINSLGGTIRVESEYGKGSNFFFTIPG